jgi:ABC-type uncharacterized transport system ATPase subunit
MTSTELSELIEAYHELSVETRNIVALTHRMTTIMAAAKQDLHKLERAIHRVQDIKHVARIPPEGAA